MARYSHIGACQMIVHRSVPEWLTMTVHRSVPEWLAMIVHRSGLTMHRSVPEWLTMIVHRSVPEWLISVCACVCVYGPSALRTLQGAKLGKAMFYYG